MSKASALADGGGACGKHPYHPHCSHCNQPRLSTRGVQAQAPAAAPAPLFVPEGLRSAGEAALVRRRGRGGGGGVWQRSGWEFDEARTRQSNVLHAMFWTFL